MRLPYKKFLVQTHPSGPSCAVSRPVIPIHVAFGHRRVAYEALVDSGADYSIFHAQLGEAIGLPVREGVRIVFAGVAGVSQEGFRHTVQLEAGRQRFRSEVVFSYGLKTPYGILGQADLFQRFVVTFHREAGWLDLRLRRRVAREPRAGGVGHGGGRRSARQNDAEHRDMAHRRHGGGARPPAGQPSPRPGG